MTLADLRTHLRMFLNEASAGFWTDADIDRYLNLARTRVNATVLAADGEFFTVSVTFPTAQDIKSYALPTDFRQFRRLEHYVAADASDIVRIPLRPFPATEGQGDWPVSTTGKPEWFVLRGSQLDLIPIPDAVYPLRLYYARAEDPLALPGDTPLAPAAYHDLLALHAAVLALTKNSEPADEWRILAAEREAQMVRELAVRAGGGALHTAGYLDEWGYA